MKLSECKLTVECKCSNCKQNIKTEIVQDMFGLSYGGGEGYSAWFDIPCPNCSHILEFEFESGE